jgi:hypothetical protein
MNRLVRGSVLLAAAVSLLWACGGDPTANNADKPVKLVAAPAVVFVANTDSVAVTVDVENALGQQLAGDFVLTTVGTGLTVTQDTLFSSTLTGQQLKTRVRYFVRATTPADFVASSFTVTSNGLSVTVPVDITPANLPGTFSTAAPNIGDTVTLTAPAPLKFTPASTIAFGSAVATVVGITADSSGLLFLAPPGAAGTATVGGLTLPYLSSAQTLVTTTPMATTTTICCTLPGTSAQGTAPTIPVPTVSGQSTAFFDAGTWAGSCGGVPCQWYRIDIPAAGAIDFSSVWDNNADLGIYVVASDGTTGVGTCDALGDVAGANFEACTVTFAAAGTYYIQMQNFASFYPDPDPAWFGITMTMP